jgi:hypothetical protein
MFTKIIEIIKSGISWGKQVATGNDGMGSASRVVALIVTPVTMGVLIAHVCMNHGLPSSEQLYGVAALIGTGCGAFAIGKFRSPDNCPNPPPPPGGN